MVCKWNKSGAGLFQASVVCYDGGQYHLIVERVPGQRKERAWDWAMWRAEGSETIGQQGYSRSAKGAMEAAERAAAAELISRAISAGRGSSHLPNVSSPSEIILSRGLAIRNDRGVTTLALGSVRRRCQGTHEAKPNGRGYRWS
jgi:hypothetical protein